ncbi:LRR receptor-like serine threonine-protein kinase [Seminavis robusta]|uniref:LRR receptor-like serine threonine-protein kinase n=1 Tax=Seminavis robusta TaxID=568900 RepID=A0A9N8EB91_9STRA|nr:LRR receptor-like serine threonine-protein kinase [Seminavis robusta]|eukprot:Sro872_g213920.1 LRR receptor-like serine threonine-protein kinase (2643) ;mRNA; r:8158-16447
MGRQALVSLACLCAVLLQVSGQAPQVDNTLHDDTSLLTPSEILLKVYDETRGMRWDKHDNWLQNTDVCTWYGITCYTATTTSDQRRVGHIQKLDLSSNRLLGTLPTVVFQLPYIETIDVRDNADLDVTFLGIADAQYLKQIAFSSTNVKSLEGIQAATQLEQLHITSLGLTGSLPTQIFQLSSLTGLFANYNKFSGSIASEIGTLTSLEEIYLFGSDLSGQIPSEFGLLTNLQVATMAENSFSGTLPTELNSLTSLRTLAINRALGLEKGSGISGGLLSFSNLKDITDLRLQNQRLSGEIPSDFLSSAPKQEVVKAELSGNAITGPVPTSLKNLKRLNLFLADNQISGVPDALCSSTNHEEIESWMGGNVGSLGCDGFLCPPGFTAPNGRATADTPCTACDDVSTWGSTRCASTPTTTSLGYSEREVLINLYNKMGGRYWKNDDGWLNPAVAICDWFGVECVDGKVTGLVMKNNDMSNSPPEELFSLPELAHINFESNAIDFLFKGIGRAKKLESLLLTSSDLSSLDDIGELSQTAIRKLYLSSSFLHGTLPSSLFTIATLEELDISHNRLVGSIPDSIGNLTNLVFLSLAKNGLSGQIPTTIGGCGKLKNLVGSDNDFSGSLPESLGLLTRLESISLHQTNSANGIGGTLPAFRNLGQLTSLQLDSNNLEGNLPEDFLRNTERGDSDEIEVRLNDNKIGGTVPDAWASRFATLFIDLSGNRISGIDSSLCSSNEWNRGMVESYSCDGILCPPGKFNEFGRQTGIQAVCRSCSHPGSVQYYGAKSCDDSENIAVQESSEFGYLKKFYDSTNGNNWKNRGGWMVSSNPCDNWYGIQCDNDGKVVSIQLESNGLTGTPSLDIFKLPMLESLSLKDNQVAFSFEHISQATSLTVLQLSGTNLDSVAGISKASSLTELHLTDNSLGGTLSTEILQLTNLRKLYMNFNQLTGAIPPGISALANLEELFLFSNRLNGQLPASIGLLTHLKRLSLAENSFSGTLPPELNDLSNLEVLSIQREGGTEDANVGINQGTHNDGGPGIFGPLPPLDNLKQLRKLYLGSNSFSGSIPYNFLDGIENKELSIEIDLIGNQLTGAVPPSLAQFGSLSLYLAGNKISTIADGLCKKQSWMQGTVANFQCDAILCPPGTYSSRGRQQDSSSPCSNCPSGTQAEFYGSFTCLGERDQFSISERTILEDFFKETTGDNWKESAGWLNSDQSICNWDGITCVDGQESVLSILLAGNGLVGSVPQEVFLLPNLEKIDLSQNSVNVSFHGVDQARKLEYLQLDGSNIQSLAGLEAATNLKLLHLANNKFPGVDFAFVVTSLTSLESLDASGNDVRVLPSLGGHTSLSYLACANCGLTGTVPAWLTTLTNLRYIHFEGNLFSGGLPVDMSSLSNLKLLDFADQVSAGGPGLRGSLPDFAGMTNLQDLHLQFNNFTGSIPTTFLQDVNVEGTVTVDLVGNFITGEIPQSLSHIQDMNLYLAANEIDSIPQEICSTSWNEKDGSASGCDHILCAKGTFNAIGRATPKIPCEACSEDGYAVHFGSTQCGRSFEKNIVQKLFGLGGHAWTQSEGWQDHADHCSWYGVQCYNGGFRDGYVEKIVLGENNLVGTLSEDVWNLVHLKELDLRKNAVVVTFDGIGNANSLESLQLSETKVSTMAGISAAPNLQYLHVTNCEVSGNIPDELFEMTQLKALYLNYNDFAATVPAAIGQLSQLQELYLFHNSLTGTLPSELGLLESVEILSLGENHFTGTLPQELNSLQELRVLALQREERQQDLSTQSFFVVVEDIGLTGNLISFNNTPKLRELYLSENHLQGDIPNDFLLAVGDTSATLRVDLSSNIFHGTIPISLARFDDLRLDITGNNLRDIPNEICAQTSWFDGELASGCDAFLCPPGTFNEYGRRIGATQCETCNFRGSAGFYGSRFCGALYPQGMTEAYMLQQVYTAVGGLGWDNSDNWLSEDVSVCGWYGVTCDNIDGQDVVTGLSLANNNLAGLVPSIVFYLPHLKKLDLGRNPIWVKFDDIQYSVLEDLSLDETNLASLEGISKASNLRTLRLQKNQLSGTIPDELYTLVNLTVLELSNCGINSQLSEDIGNLQNLVTLLLDRNYLFGQLPRSLGSLTRLHDLFLSDNNFWGTLPTEMNNMVSLESIFLDSYNRDGAGVSGTILSFSKMPKLRSLHLGGNSFTGFIPHDLFGGVDKFSDIVEIDLASNHLTGSIPAGLFSFEKLNLDLTDNYIASLDSSFCSKSSWQQGMVGQFGCDAILCPAGTYNSNGRQSSADTPCIQCSGDSVPPYVGRTSCLSDEKAKERQILVMLYNATNGHNWKNNYAWLDPNKDYCDWYGITCVDSTVNSILLGSNNLSGRIPEDIFQLWNLRVLWLYSNPIDFRFDGIRKASRLVDLRLDSTGLKSLDGLENALALHEVDFRFNRLEGELPDLAGLSDLKTFSCSANRLSGPLPSFATNTELVSLRAAGNAFSGSLPAFDRHPSLSALDVSANDFSGSIPHKLLDLADTTASIFLDLSSNDFTGSVPKELERFSDLTLYLRDNYIDSIPASLCSMHNWNQADVGLDGCDAILCPPQTFAAITGRSSRSGSKCEPCEAAQYYGSTSCRSTTEIASDSSATSSMMAPYSTFGGFLLSAMSVIVCSLFF